MIRRVFVCDGRFKISSTCLALRFTLNWHSLDFVRAVREAFYFHKKCELPVKSFFVFIETQRTRVPKKLAWLVKNSSCIWQLHITVFVPWQFFAQASYTFLITAFHGVNFCIFKDMFTNKCATHERITKAFSVFIIAIIRRFTHFIILQSKIKMRTISQNLRFYIL